MIHITKIGHWIRQRRPPRVGLHIGRLDGGYRFSTEKGSGGWRSGGRGDRSGGDRICEFKPITWLTKLVPKIIKKMDLSNLRLPWLQLYLCIYVWYIYVHIYTCRCVYICISVYNREICWLQFKDHICTCLYYERVGNGGDGKPTMVATGEAETREGGRLKVRTDNIITQAY